MFAAGAEGEGCSARGHGGAAVVGSVMDVVPRVAVPVSQVSKGSNRVQRVHRVQAPPLT